MTNPKERRKNNETHIINVERLSGYKSKEDIDITEIVLLSGFAGMVVIWVIACLFW